MVIKKRSKNIRVVYIWIGLTCFAYASEIVLNALSNSLTWPNDTLLLIKKIRAAFCYPVITYVGYLLIKRNDKSSLGRLLMLFGVIIIVSGCIALFRTLWELASIIH